MITFFFGILTNSLNTPPSSWNLAATKSNNSIWCSPEERAETPQSKVWRQHFTTSPGDSVQHKLQMLCKGSKLCVRTGIGPGIKHVVQHGAVVHVEPVGNVSQSVWATEPRQVRVKDDVDKSNGGKNTWLCIYCEGTVTFRLVCVIINTFSKWLLTEQEMKEKYNRKHVKVWFIWDKANLQSKHHPRWT